jgi:hypothetical protein
MRKIEQLGNFVIEEKGFSNCEIGEFENNVGGIGLELPNYKISQFPNQKITCLLSPRDAHTVPSLTST